MFHAITREAEVGALEHKQEQEKQCQAEDRQGGFQGLPAVRQPITGPSWATCSALWDCSQSRGRTVNIANTTTLSTRLVVADWLKGPSKYVLVLLHQMCTYGIPFTAKVILPATTSWEDIDILSFYLYNVNSWSNPSHTNPLATHNLNGTFLLGGAKHAPTSPPTPIATPTGCMWPGQSKMQPTLHNGHDLG